MSNLTLQPHLMIISTISRMSNITQKHNLITPNIPKMTNITLQPHLITSIDPIYLDVFNPAEDGAILGLTIFGWVLMEFFCEGKIRQIYRLKSILLTFKSVSRIVLPFLFTILDLNACLQQFVHFSLYLLQKVSFIYIQVLSMDFLYILYKCTHEVQLIQRQSQTLKTIFICISILVVQFFECVILIGLVVLTVGITRIMMYILSTIQPIESLFSCFSTLFCVYFGTHALLPICKSVRFVERACPRLRQRNIYLFFVIISALISQLFMMILTVIDKAAKSYYSVKMLQCLVNFETVNERLLRKDECNAVLRKGENWYNHFDPTWAVVLEMVISVIMAVRRRIKQE